MLDARKIHEESIVIDAVSPLLLNKSYTDLYRQGGVTAVCPTVSLGGTAGEQVKVLGSWLRHIRQDPSLILSTSVRDIERAKELNRLALIFHFQGTDSIEDNLDLVDAYYALGVRVIQLTYNVKNRVGDGCTERTDAGLSEFGIKLVQRLNELGIAVDCSHTGVRTTLDAMEVSTAPVIFTHANARSVFDSKRNITDEQIRGIAKTNGVIGVNIVPYYIVKHVRPTIDQLLDHVSYIASLVGVDHVGIGFDYFGGQQPFVSDEEANQIYRSFIDAGKWDPNVTPPPTQLYPEGLDTPAYMANLTPALIRRGFSEQEVKKILGGNWMRVFAEIWK
ncbi:membrane dipeptidase [Caballeronia pedi]|uniref:Membrane dipeptidase n=1 Tax=Caballeronia pedi TaxID=1777141 RepID=A0A157ZSB0_9BURK|nr:dipeptidase [Caballeronia pedi]SAK48391.1 membrane dipeptidase [Caballeronia pedi]